MSARRAFSKGNPFDVLESAFEQFVGPVRNGLGRFRVSRSAFGRVVFETTVFGRIVRRSDDDAVGKPPCLASVVRQDGMRDDGGRGVAKPFLDHDGDAGGGKDLERCRQCRLGQSVRVDAQKSGPVMFFDALSSQMA